MYKMLCLYFDPEIMTLKHLYTLKNVIISVFGIRALQKIYTSHTHDIFMSI